MAVLPADVCLFPLDQELCVFTVRAFRDTYKGLFVNQ